MVTCVQSLNTKLKVSFSILIVVAIFYYSNFVDIENIWSYESLLEYLSFDNKPSVSNCININHSSVSTISWKKNSNCTDWKFVNNNDKIFDLKQMKSILSNSLIIFLGNSVERRLLSTIITLLNNHTLTKTITYNSNLIPDIQAIEPVNLPNLNTIIIHNRVNALHDTIRILLSKEFEQHIKNKVNKRIYLFFSFTVCLIDWYNAYIFNNITLNKTEINCNVQVPTFMNRNRWKTNYGKQCWDKNKQIQNLSVIYWIKNQTNILIQLLNKKWLTEWNNYGLTFNILFRTPVPQDCFKPLIPGTEVNIRGLNMCLIKNEQNNYYVKHKFYQLLCNNLVIPKDKWNIIDLHEFMYDKSISSRHNCLPSTGGTIHFKDLGRYLYLQKFLNSIQTNNMK